MSGAVSSLSLRRRSGCKRVCHYLTHLKSIYYYPLPDAAASFSSVEMSAPASGARAQTRSGPGGYWTGARAGCLVGDDVDPHPHVRQALHRHQI